MKAEQFVRAIFLILAFGIFLYQIKQSIEKFIDPPVIQAISMMKANELPLQPIFHLCQPFEDQIDNMKAKEYGYDAYREIIHVGVLLNGSISWSGQYGNTTFEEIINDVYCFNYTGLKIEEIRNETVTNVTRTISFLFPSGFCNTLNFESFPLMGRISSETSLRFSISDPRKANDLRTEEKPEGRVTLGSVEKFEWKRIEIKYELFDAKINDGVTCTDYANAKYGSSYGECVKKVLRTKLFNIYGCMPPWMSTGNENRLVIGYIIFKGL